MNNVDEVRSKLTGAARLEQLSEGTFDVIDVPPDRNSHHVHPTDGDTGAAGHLVIVEAAAQALFGHYSEEPSAGSRRALRAGGSSDAASMYQAHAGAAGIDSGEAAHGGHGERAGLHRDADHATYTIPANPASTDANDANGDANRGVRTGAHSANGKDLNEIASAMAAPSDVKHANGDATVDVGADVKHANGAQLEIEADAKHADGDAAPGVWNEAKDASGDAMLDVEAGGDLRGADALGGERTRHATASSPASAGDGDVRYPRVPGFGDEARASTREVLEPRDAYAAIPGAQPDQRIDPTTRAGVDRALASPAATAARQALAARVLAAHGDPARGGGVPGDTAVATSNATGWAVADSMNARAGSPGGRAATPVTARATTVADAGRQARAVTAIAAVTPRDDGATRPGTRAAKATVIVDDAVLPVKPALATVPDATASPALQLPGLPAIDAGVARTAAAPTTLAPAGTPTAHPSSARRHGASKPAARLDTLDKAPLSDAGPSDEIPRAAFAPRRAGGPPHRALGTRQKPGDPTSEAQARIAALRSEAASSKDDIETAAVPGATRVGTLAATTKAEIMAEVQAEKAGIQATQASERAQAEQTVQQTTQTAATSVAGLEAQLEQAVTRELGEIDAEIASASTDTRTKLDIEKARVQDEAKTQIDKLQALQLTDQEAQIKQRIAQEKIELRQQADAQYRQLVETSQVDKQKVLDTARDEGKRVVDESTKQAADVETKGAEAAQRARSKAQTEAAEARERGQHKAAQARAEQKRQDSESVVKKLTDWFRGDPGAAAIAESERIAGDIITKGNLAAQTLTDKAKADAASIRTAGKDQQLKLTSKGDDDAKALDARVALAFSTMANQQTELGKKMDDDAAKQIADAKAQVATSIQQIRAKTTAAAANIDQELARSDANMAAERAKRVTAVQRDADQMRAKLATAKLGDLKRLQQQVQQTTAAIDLESETAQNDADRISKAAVVAAKREADTQIGAIAAEATKAIATVDAVLGKAIAGIEANAAAAEAAIAQTGSTAATDLEHASADAQASLKTDGAAAVRSIQDQAAKSTTAIDAELVRQSAAIDKMTDGTLDPEVEAKKQRDALAQAEADRQREAQQQREAQATQDAVAKVQREVLAQGEANKLVAAMGGWQTDTDAVLQSLRGRSPEEIKAIQAAYKARTGNDLDAALKGGLSGPALVEAMSKLSGDPVQAAVGELQNAGGMFGGTFSGDAEKMKAVLANPNLTPAQRQQIFDGFEAQTGQDLHVFFDSQLSAEDAAALKATLGPVKLDVFDPSSPPPLRPNESPPDAQKTRQAAAALRQAMDSWGTDEAKIESVLKGKSPAEIHAIRVAFLEEYQVDLKDQLVGELSGTQLAIVKAELKSDPVAAAAATLDDASSGLGTSEQTIEDQLASITDPVQRSQVAAEFQKRTGITIGDMIQGELSGSDKDLVMAYAKGDTAQATAIKLDQAANGGILHDASDSLADTMGIDRKELREDIAALTPIGQAMTQANGGKPSLNFHGDADKMYDVLLSIADPVERNEVKHDYLARTGEDLDTTINDKFTGAQRDAVQAYAVGDIAGGSASRMRAAADGLGTDEKAIYAQLEGKTDAQRKQIIDAYNDRYGRDGGVTFDQMLVSELSNLDLEKARLLAEDGKVPPEFAIDYALSGCGTDEEDIKATLNGKSAKEIAEISAAWDIRHRHGPSLQDSIKSDMPDGRDGFEVAMMLEGEPQPTDPDYEQRRLDRAKRMYQYERGYLDSQGHVSQSDLISARVMDLFSDSGRDLDRDHARLEELRALRDRNGMLTPEQRTTLDGGLAWQDLNKDNYVASKNSVTDGLAEASAITLGAVLTAATGGLASPIVIAALSGLAGISVKTVMQGEAYGVEDISIDLAKTTLQAATAGGMELLGPTLDAALEAYGPVVTTAVKGAIAGAGNSATTAAFDEPASRNLGDWAQNVVQSATLGAAGGFVGGTFRGLTNAANISNPLLKRIQANVLDSLGSALVDRSMFEGDPEALARKWGTVVARGTIQGLGDALGEHNKPAATQAGDIAAQVVAEQGGPPAAQDAARAEATQQVLDAESRRAAGTPTDDAERPTADGDLLELDGETDASVAPPDHSQHDTQPVTWETAAEQLKALADSEALTPGLYDLVAREVRSIKNPGATSDGPSGALATAEADLTSEQRQLLADKTQPARTAWDTSAELSKALAAAKTGELTPEQRALLAERIKDQVTDMRLVAVAKAGDTVISVISPGGGEIGVKRMNDALVGHMINDRLINARKALFRAAFEAEGITFVDHDYKATTLLSKVPLENEVISRVLERIDLGMKPLITATMEAGLEYWENPSGDVTDAEGQSAPERVANIRAQLDAIKDYRHDFQIGMDKLGNDIDYASLLDAKMKSTKAALMARALAAERLTDETDMRSGSAIDDRVRNYSEEEFIKFCKQTVALKSLIIEGGSTEGGSTEEVSTLPYNGEVREVFDGDKMDRDILRSIRKGTYEDEELSGPQQTTLTRLRNYFTRVNVFDYLKSFKGNETGIQWSKIRDAIPVVEALDNKTEPLTPAIVEEISRILKGHIAQAGTPSAAEFYNAASPLPDRTVLNADIKDLGLLTFDGNAATMDAVASNPADLTRASMRASDRVIEHKREALYRFTSFYQEVLIPEAIAQAQKLGRDDLLERINHVIDHEPEPLVLLGGDEITISLHPVFNEFEGLVPAAVEMLTNPAIANARVAVTHTGESNGIEGHTTAMAASEAGHDMIKKYEALARDLRQKAKRDPAVREQANAIAAMLDHVYVSNDTGNDQTIFHDRAGKKVDMKEIKDEADGLLGLKGTNNGN